ncbi:MAG: tyrosine-type recombinase/integrase [Bifidobacterium aquikefiri]|uniref:Integrase n=1 Tax=Bifidobacterium aquikefiri TaxID=1653207 RepID=A0A261G261_9BIFI|nr:tyrosine-type recombinase/integrase [Bifidobacterium aquikefiri]OZG65512.1 integrase [Bifidobacterium aquikefiri]
MASVESYETKSGKRYRVRYRKPDGSSTDKRGFKRKKDATDWAADNVTVAINTGTYTDPGKGKTTIAKLYEAWLAVGKPLWKPSYIHTVETSWRTHVEETWGSRQVVSIQRDEVQEWVSELAARKSASTVTKAYAILRSIMEDAANDRRIPRNPLTDIKLPVKRRTRPRIYLTISQLLAFADEASNANSIGDERRALILLLGFCGLRWGEARGLRVKDLDFGKGRLHVEQNIVSVGSRKVPGSPKNHEMRDVPMPEIVATALREVAAKRSGVNDLVFMDTSGSPIREQSVSELHNRTWYVSALRRAKLPMVSPHDLRHTAASIAVHAGANVKALQRMLGHKSAAMTLDVYADLFDSDLDDVSASIDKAVKNCGQNVGTESGSDKKKDRNR